MFKAGGDKDRACAVDASAADSIAVEDRVMREGCGWLPFTTPALPSSGSAGVVRSGDIGGEGGGDGGILSSRSLSSAAASAWRATGSTRVAYLQRLSLEAQLAPGGEPLCRLYASHGEAFRSLEAFGAPPK
jgi:hypothetical protein